MCAVCLYMQILCVVGLKRTNGVMNILAVGTAKVESLKGALAKTKKEAKANKVATNKVVKALEEERTARRKHEARVEEIE